MSVDAPERQSSLIFAAVFIIVWIGGAIVALNGSLLGGTTYVLSWPNYHGSSFFFSVSLLGYCLFPIVVATIVCMFVKNFVARMIVVGIGFLWAAYGSCL